MRVGLLGCGNVSPQYAIGLGLFPGVELVACADLDGPRAEALAAQHGIAALSPDELIGGDAVDILVNISPGMAHVGVSSAALAAGKHVYSEKPLAVDVAGGTLLLERSRAAGLRLGCAPDTFLGSQLQTARRLLDAGAIGTPVAAHATMIGGGHERWHPNPAIFYTPAGGPMLDMGPYYVTALLSFFGPARRVAASTSARLPERVVGIGPLEGQKISVETPTHYAGVVDYAGGPTATFIVSFDIPHGRTGIEIFGTQGSLAIPDPNVFDAPIVRRTRVGTELREETMPVEHVTGAGRGIGVAELADAIRTNRPHRASAEQALHALETMTAFQRSSDSGAHVTLETTCKRPEPLPTATEEVLFLTVISLLTPSFVARQTGYALSGDWSVGDRATNEHYAPLETFEERFGELLALTRSLGFEAIDLWTAHLGPGWASDEHLAIARALLEEHDLTVVSLAGGFGGTPEELRATCRVAHGVGTDLLAGSLRLLTADRDAAVAILQGEGIRLGVENHPDERTPADLLRKIGDGADGHIGAALDTGWWVTNGFDPVVAVHELKDWLFHVHLKDVYAPEFELDHRNAAHTEGAVPLEETVRALFEVGYTGPIGLEDHSFDRDPTPTLPRGRELLKGWLQERA